MRASPGQTFAARLDRCALFAMACGVALMLQPWWGSGLRVGFFVTLGATLLQIVTGHLPRTRA